MARCILTAHWTGGDVYPFIKIGRGLAKRGHSVALCTHSVYKDVAEKEGFDFIPWDTSKEYDSLQKDLVKLLNPVKDPEGYRDFRRKYQNKEKRLDECRRILEYCDDTTVIIGRHRSSIAGMLAAEKAGVPFVSVVLAPSYIIHMPILEALFGLEMTSDINEIRAELELEPIHSWAKYLAAPKKVIGFWPHWFAETGEEWLIKPEALGFPFENEGEGAETEDVSKFVAFIEKHGTPVLVAGGSSKAVSPDFFDVAIKGCRGAGYPAVVVTKYRELLPENLPEDVKWFPYLPFSKVVAKTKMLIHHGGIGTVYDALSAGIPQFIYAADSDHPDNANRVKNLGAGDFLPPMGWNEYSLVKGLQALDKPEIRENCENYAQILAVKSPLEEACSRIESLVGKKTYLLDIKDFGASYVEGQVKKTAPSEGKEKQAISPEKRKLLMKLMQKKRAAG